jgi:hypothetical protein
VVKDLIISSVYSRLGEALHSGVISNLGGLSLPPSLERRIERFHFSLDPNHVMKKACGVHSYKGQLHISFTSVTESSELERLFFTHLTRSGVPITLKEH